MTSKQLAWLIRRHGIEMTHVSGGSHIGAILSVADIMGVLYTDILKFDSKNPNWDDRDRFILSKGHAGAAVYAAIAENGFFPVEELKPPAGFPVMFPIICRELIFPPVHLVTVFRSLPAEHLRQSRTARLFVPLL